jgi:hypothetical protein
MPLDQEIQVTLLVQFEVTIEIQVSVFSRLLRIEIIKGGDATPTHLNDSRRRSFLSWWVSDVIVTRSSEF